MKVLSVCAVFLVCALAFASAFGPYRGYDFDYGKDYYAPAYYSFNYGVKDPYTYADFGHEETRNGDSTKGQYSVLLPDGRRQIVTYYVNGDSGYVADIKYIQESNYSPYRATYPPYKPY